MAIVQKPINGTGRVILVGGVFTATFGLVMGLLSLFVMPIACTFVGSLLLIILGLLFLIGLFIFLSGLVLSRRKVRPK